MHNRLPGFVVFWLVVTTVLCIWDASYILLRPRSMQGGDLFDYFFPYVEYIKVDPGYGDLKDPFVIAQTWGNIIEMVLNVVVIILHFARSPLTVLLGFTVNLMTLYKTVIYIFVLFVHGVPPAFYTHLDAWIKFWLLPTIPWVLFPFFSIRTLGSYIASDLRGSYSEKKRQ